MMMFKQIFLIAISVVMCLMVSCSDDFMPKPKGYFRIDLPQKQYRTLDSIYPFKFDYPGYAMIVPDKRPNAEPNWINVEFKSLRATIFISYKKVNKNVEKFTTDAHEMAYKHAVKADAINEKLYTNPDLKKYGILYEIKGNAASPLQFYLTDSTSHFLRGSLYFNVMPNKDSIAPVLDFVGKDVEKLIETLEWK